MASLALLRRCTQLQFSKHSRGANATSRLCKQRMYAKASFTSSALTFLSPNEWTTHRLAAHLSRIAAPTDCICLYGDVGAGKSVFSRAFMRAIAEDDELPVPSPTYLLQNTYDDHEGELCFGASQTASQGRSQDCTTDCLRTLARVLLTCAVDAGPTVHHFDLYRLAGPADLGRLQLEDAFSTGICLIEWAERLGSCAPAARLDVHLQLLPEEAKDRISGDEGIKEMIDRAASVPEDLDPEEEDSAYVDRRWRQIMLVPRGDSWAVRVKKLGEEAQSRADSGLILLQHLP